EYGAKRRGYPPASPHCGCEESRGDDIATSQCGRDTLVCAGESRESWTIKPRTFGRWSKTSDAAVCQSTDKSVCATVLQLRCRHFARVASALRVAIRRHPHQDFFARCGRVELRDLAVREEGQRVLD